MVKRTTTELLDVADRALLAACAALQEARDNEEAKARSLDDSTETPNRELRRMRMMSARSLADKLVAARAVREGLVP